MASPKRALGAGAIAGLFLFTSYALQTIGLAHTSAIKAGFITGLSVVLVPVLSAFLLRIPLNKSTFLGVVLATIGLALLSLKRDLSVSPADVWVLGGAISFAFQIVTLGHFSPRMDAAPLATVQTAVVGLGSLPLALSMENFSLELDGQVRFAIVFAAVFATSLAFTMQTTAQRFTSPSHTALILATEPVFAALFGYILAGDRLGPRALSDAV